LREHWTLPRSGNRADAGRLAHGLPKSNKFNRGVE
jgi:topoisomerase-4 subunit A